MSSDSRKPNGHAFDTSDWRADDEEVRSLDRRLGMLDQNVNDRFDMLNDKFDRLMDLVKATRGDIVDLHQRVIRVLEKQDDQEKSAADLDQRVVAIESRRNQSRKRK